ncbi:asparaginase [Alphaproteobacteria bacterium KMM 3653]|uniref:Asparaginase n=1 Tax=Harenicola maris TaxID=2841044 RepID=A0AAP2CS09_9RHOB|nr:asparaginase [Harenicola maris]
MASEELVRVTRGERVESLHRGHAVVCRPGGEVVASWGDPSAIIYPRSSAKMIQALPLIESGAAKAHGLGQSQLALACASHQGAQIHVDAVGKWLGELGLGDDDFRCGAEESRDIPLRNQMIKTDSSPCQIHNNCSGKHAGFLTLSRHLGAGPEYIAPDHPVQKAVFERFDEACGETSPGYGIDGCSAPNPAVSLQGFARAIADFAGAEEGSPMEQLRSAMMAYPELVAGETRACTELMRALPGKAALKTGAEGVFIAILPEQKLGIALKIEDGTTRASEAAITALLCRYAGLDPQDPAALRRNNAVVPNRNNMVTGHITAVESLSG